MMQGKFMNIDQLIKKTIKNINEEKEKTSKKPKKIKTKVGRGNLKTYIKKGRSRAENDPNGLMKDLGIPLDFVQNPKIENLGFRQHVAAILRRSFEKDPAMAQAFVGVRYYDNAADAFVRTNADLISSRDAAMFVNNILRAAQNANILSLDEDIEITPTGNEEVYILFIQD